MLSPVRSPTRPNVIPLHSTRPVQRGFNGVLRIRSKCSGRIGLYRPLCTPPTTTTIEYENYRKIGRNLLRSANNSVTNNKYTLHVGKWNHWHAQQMFGQNNTFHCGRCKVLSWNNKIIERLEPIIELVISTAFNTIEVGPRCFTLKIVETL